MAISHRESPGMLLCWQICTLNFLWLCHQLIIMCVCVDRVTVDALKCAVAMANRSWQSVASGSAIWVDLTAKPSAGLEATRRACFWISSVSITRGRLCLVLRFFSILTASTWEGCQQSRLYRKSNKNNICTFLQSSPAHPEHIFACNTLGSISLPVAGFAFVFHKHKKKLNL